MKPSKFLMAFTVNALLGVLLAAMFSFSPLVGVAAVNAAGAVMHVVKLQSGFVFFDGLAQEIWLPDVKEDFFPDTSFLSQAQDLSALVDNDAINLAEAGADPTVLVDNVAYPIAEADASDTPLRMVLKTYDTTSTVVRNAVALELAYDQRVLYTGKHKRVLLQKLCNDAAYAYAPSAVAALNPIIDATGDANDVFLDRIIELQTFYNSIDAPLEGRILVLDPNHAAMIAKEDKKLYKAFEAEPGKMLFGFKTYMYSKNPLYIKATSVKAAQNAAYVGATHGRSSIAFLKDEVMKAQGTFKLFSTLNSPSHKGDVFNYQMRGLVTPIMNKFRGAIMK